MKKLAIILFLVLTLTSCFNKSDENKDTSNTNTEIKNETKKTKAEDKSEEIKNNQIVKVGDLITVAYTGSLTDGTIFDASSKHQEPLEFIVGIGKVIPGFDNGVIGMKVGETKTLNIPAKDAYGENKIMELREEDLKAINELGGLKTEDIKVGDNVLPLTNNILKIVEIKDGKYFAEHPNPLIGKDLVFEVQILKINELPLEESTKENNTSTGEVGTGKLSETK